MCLIVFECLWCLDLLRWTWTSCLSKALGTRRDHQVWWVGELDIALLDNGTQKKNENFGCFWMGNFGKMGQCAQLSQNTGKRSTKAEHWRTRTDAAGKQGQWGNAIFFGDVANHLQMTCPWCHCLAQTHPNTSEPHGKVTASVAAMAMIRVAALVLLLLYPVALAARWCTRWNYIWLWNALICFDCPCTMLNKVA